MQTKNIIKSTANVIKITNLQKGDVVKRISSEGYSNDEHKTKYSVVLDILNDGHKTFIEMLEYEKSYEDISAEIKVFSGEDELALFPTEIEEVQNYLEDSIKSIKEKVKDKRKELFNLEKGLKKAQEFVSGEMSKKLSTVEHEQLTQKEFEQEQKQIK